MGRYWRSPRTTQERRANSFHRDLLGFIREEVVGGVSVRVRIPGPAHRELPQDRDDIAASYWGHRTWKRFRRFQWKEMRSSKR